MIIEYRQIDSLIPYAGNSRTHSAAQISELVRSILEWGWTVPVLADAAGIVAGHGRIDAARLIYADGGTISLPSGAAIPAGTVPVIDCTGWPEAKRRAYIIADNKLPEHAGWDTAILRDELEGLQELDYDLELIGFSQDEIDMIMAEELEIMESAGSMSGSNYGDVRSERIPVNIMGIGGLLDRELLERVKERLVEHGAEAGADNGEHLVTIFEAYLR